MLDSDQEPSYNLSKNLLLLPRILKLMKDMVDDSTPLIFLYFQNLKCLVLVTGDRKVLLSIQRKGFNFKLSALV